MRLILATGVVLCLSSTPAYAGGFSGGGVGQGFTSGVGWSLCDGVAKVLVKGVRRIKGKNHNSEAANSNNDRGPVDSHGMTPDEVYHRGLEDGYAKAREEAGGSLYEGRYAREPGSPQADGDSQKYVQTRVSAKRLGNGRVVALRHTAAHSRSHYISHAQQNKQKTAAGSQTANSSGHRQPTDISVSGKNRFKPTMASQLALD